MENEEQPKEGARSKTKPSLQATPSAPATTASEPDLPLPQRFAEAYRGYAQALQNAADEAQLRSYETHYNLQLELQRVQLETRKSWEETQLRYARGLREAAAGGQQGERSAHDLAREYQESLSTAQESGAQRWEKAQSGCQETLKQAQQSYQQHCGEAYREYLRALQAAWAAADPDRLDPGSLTQIANHLLSAAAMAARTPIA